MTECSNLFDTIDVEAGLDTSSECTSSHDVEVHIEKLVESQVVSNEDTRDPASTTNTLEPFIHNNWIKSNNNQVLLEIDALGGAIWLNARGELSYRFSPNDEIHESPSSKASKVLSSYLERPIAVFAHRNSDIEPQDLKLVQSTEFLPFTRKEFTDDNKRNKFRPTKYMELEARKYKNPSTILSLIHHPVNNDRHRAEWTINWLAGFFQKLRKSQVSLVLRGIQGAGKGVLFDQIIKPLFGENQTIQINDKVLNTNFLGSIVESRLFTNLDEVSHNLASSKAVKNFIKALVTNKSISAEKKHQNLEREIKLWGQVLITSNEPYILEIEPSDRRFTVYETGKTLKATSFLGYKTADKIFKQIEAELEDFALYLKAYDVDWKMFDTAEDTPEKEALMQATTDKFTLFVNALKAKNITFFEDIGEYTVALLQAQFDEDRVEKEDLTRLFNDCFEEHITSRTLMKRLRTVDPYFFGDNNIQKSNGKRYYKIPKQE